MTQNTASLWSQDQDFSDQKTGIVVRVQKKATFRPVYSIQISKTREDGKLVASIPVFISALNGLNDPDCAATISKLLLLAVAYIEKETRLRAEEVALEKAARSKKATGYG